MSETSQNNLNGVGQPPVRSLDGRGAGAAWLILKVACAVTALEPGQVLEVWGSDPRLLSDLPPVLARHGCRLLEAGQRQEGLRFLLLKPGSPRPEGPSAPAANHCRPLGG